MDMIPRVIQAVAGPGYTVLFTFMTALCAFLTQVLCLKRALRLY